jgi:formyltetrahydrofolate hydrolase
MSAKNHAILLLSCPDGRDIEKLVFARAVKMHLENRIIVYENRTIVFDT